MRPFHALAGVLVLAGGWLASVATESNGESLEITTVLQLVAGLITLLGVSVFIARRGDSRRALRADKLQP